MGFRKTLIVALCGLGVMTTGIGQAMALTLDGSGTVTNWGVSPFGPGVAYNRTANHQAWTPSPGAYAVRWKEENNYSPIGYPVYGHTPSPGLPNGEVFDLEAFYCRINRGLSQDSLQVLIVTSMPTHTYSSTFDYNYRIGDLFMDLEGDGTVDFAVTTTDWDTNQAWQAYDVAEQKYVAFDHTGAPGSLYGISYDTSTVIDPDDPNCEVVTGVGHNAASGLYGGNADLAYAEEMFRPWVVDEDKASLVGSVGLEIASFDYGDRIGGGYYLLDPNWAAGGVLEDENATYFYEYTIPLSMLGGTLDESNLMYLNLHMTTECGNDVIDASGGGLQPPMPEPLTTVGLLMGLCGIGGYLRRRRLTS